MRGVLSRCDKKVKKKTFVTRDINSKWETRSSPFDYGVQPDFKVSDHLITNTY